MHRARFIIALCICMGVLASAEVDPALRGHRSKRSPTPFSAEERMGILDLHNQLRSGVSPEASNMRYMVWDDSLATMAQQWSDGCVYEHGNPTNISPFDPVGQNLWAGTLYDDGTGATQAWYNEVTDYNYESNQCSAVCGHYTQVVWAESYAVGCGRTLCANLVGFVPNAYMITCNYGPAGNFVGQRPYLTGLSCSECSTGSGQCFNNQCRPCSEHSEPCECRYTCENCGILNSDCTCTCQNGYRDNRCTTACVDTHEDCGANPGWPLSWCGNPQFSFVDAYCPAFCGICDPPDPNFVCRLPTTSATTTTNAPTPAPTTMKAPTPAKTTTRAPTPAATTTKAPTPAATTTRASTAKPTTTSSTTSTQASSRATTPSQAPTTRKITTRAATSELTTITTTVTTQPTCAQECLNGGTLTTSDCSCRCPSTYQGRRCQNLKTQVQYGIILVIRGNIAIFPRFKNDLFAIVSAIVTSTCNGQYFSVCCPNSGTKNTYSVDPEGLSPTVLFLLLLYVLHISKGLLQVLHLFLECRHFVLFRSDIVVESLVDVLRNSIHDGVGYEGDELVENWLRANQPYVQQRVFFIPLHRDVHHIRVTKNERLDYVDSSHVSVAQGFPEILDQFTFALMLLVTPPSTSDLCSAGVQAVAKRSVEVQIKAGRNKRQIEEGGYLDQDVLYDALTDNLETISRAINATIESVERGQVEENPLTLSQTLGIIVAIIVFIVLAGTLTIICGALCWQKRQITGK
ncbi:uncharacterized protein [Diadema setosum]|uniref:uncharacterized protein n=1 Tax=Diadema setosum TaxID=31175 RepID=UPI003B3BBAED